MIDITNNAVEIVTPTINESLRVGNYYDDEDICVDVKNVSVMFNLSKNREEGLKESDLLIINGPDYEQTVELLSAADCVDGLVYVVKAGYDQMESTKEAIYTLGFTKAKTLGYVITV